MKKFEAKRRMKALKNQKEKQELHEIKEELKRTLRATKKMMGLHK